MEQTKCIECEKSFHPDDCCPIIRYADYTVGEICRKDLKKWLEGGFLQNIPFWARKEGLDVK